ncbi:hypothetical protein BGAPBR_H0017 (plasmid) [Borreliella garinii PBr]|uniref:Uncharacterized protein n=1 Tax=Borreliella garinii PBr TaxID=498743 RepID=B8F1G9_BORGR|nr:hypothetical protein BGAPBR_H0017 [Borreliella garinii PBr]
MYFRFFTKNFSKKLIKTVFTIHSYIYDSHKLNVYINKLYKCNGTCF